MKEACPTQRRDDAHVFGSGCRLFVQAQVWDGRELLYSNVFEWIWLLNDWIWLSGSFWFASCFAFGIPSDVSDQGPKGSDEAEEIVRIPSTSTFQTSPSSSSRDWFHMMHAFLPHFISYSTGIVAQPDIFFLYIYLILLAWQLKESRWEYAHAVHCQEGSEIQLEAFSLLFAVQSDPVKYHTSFNFLVLVL